ncbi:HprK-related kinase B [Rhodovulum adriaticum]|uniref:HprK-related kinase B n=1 Tax=Rhodovulum adriaticum TaxID=35804 RepID=A0A4R2NMN3_RHOAD|nr:HprK-related kinase B [Rhodovulum adriaticum]MBK1635777.1 aldolase [Rhodovulum adriaticum]TCP22514.1 HprK-related kinase B [Rhodovulum adriaticum]
MRCAADVIARLDLAPAEAADPFHLTVGPVSLRVLCPDPLRGELVAYFDEALSDTPGDIVIRLLPGQRLDPEPDWTPWLREPGKTGRKDAVVDLDDARLVKKVRSGVTFLQSPDAVLAFGPLAENVSTVINFINTQVLNAGLREGWQLCHAAAVTDGRRTLAISGLSGGGKSTTVLRMMDIAGKRFVSNDRLLVRGGDPVQALGIPKHPRINPGTILGNPRLAPMLSPQRRAELAALPPGELWALEEKHDLMIGQVYGPGRVQYAAPLTDFWVLNWRHDSAEPTRLADADLSRRPDLLGAIMKSPGPFYQHPGGRFEPNGARPDPAPFLSALAGLRVREVSGKIDFDVLADHGRRLFDG